MASFSNSLLTQNVKTCYFPCIMKLKCPVYLRFLPAILALTIALPAMAQTSAPAVPTPPLPEEMVPFRIAFAKAAYDLFYLSDDEAVGRAVNALNHVQFNLGQIWSRQAYLDAASSIFLNPTIDKIKGTTEVLKRLKTALSFPTRRMPRVPQEISSRNWNYFQDNWDEADLWPTVFKPLDEIQENVATNRTFDPLTEKAGTILQATAHRINEELRRVSDLDVVSSGPQHNLLTLNWPGGGNGSEIVEYDPEKVGYQEVWLYVNQFDLQSVDTNFQGQLESKQAEIDRFNSLANKTRTKNSFGCSRGTRIDSIPDVKEEDILCLGKLLPDTTPWNSQGSIWKAAIDSIKVDYLNDPDPTCTKKKPCKFAFAIHPRVLAEMVELLDLNFDTMPGLLPMEDLP